MSAALRILLLLAAGLFLAPVPASAHVFPENRVRGVSDYPSGQHVETLALTPEIATGCASHAVNLASGRAYWLSRDPIGERGGLNLYGYAGNDPIDNVDPSGLIFLAGNSHPNNGPWNITDTQFAIALGLAPIVGIESGIGALGIYLNTIYHDLAASAISSGSGTK